MIGLGIEGLRKQYKEQLANYRLPDDKYKCTAFEANPDKNRYAQKGVHRRANSSFRLAIDIKIPEIKTFSNFRYCELIEDVICLDETRVRLTMDVPPSTDYIHANWVRFEGHDKVFIATQGPLDNTIEDFWRMVFQEGCPNIVNLTKCIEDGKIKSSQYWPLDPGSFQCFGKMFVNTKKVESEGKFLIYTVEVLPEGCSNSNIVKVIHMTSWPDRGLPMSGRHVLRLIRQVNGDKLDNGPIVMHCSAGIGRTGTIILIDVILRRLFRGKEIDMVDIFKQLRNQRASCIQLEGQYLFIVVSVLDYVKIKLPKYKDRVNKFMEDFKATIPT